MSGGMDYYIARLRRAQDEQCRQEQRMSHGGLWTRDDYIVFLPLALLLAAVVVAVGVIVLLLRYA